MANSLLGVMRVPELRKRILFTVSVLVIFRLGAAIPIPGINASALQNYFLSQQNAGTMGITEYIDFFAGGAFRRFSIFMLGIMPYITTSIIMNLLVLIFPRLKKISQEDGGRKKIQRYTRYATIIVCLVQSFITVQYARSMPSDILTLPLAYYAPISMLTVTTGTILLMWMGEQITQRGIGNGISLIIFSGIVARLPQAMIQLIRQVREGSQDLLFVVIVFALFASIVALVIYEQQGQRKIPVHYAKRVVGRRMYGAQSAYIPFKVNPSGVIPVIFASSVLSVPIQLASGLRNSYSWIASLEYALRPQGPIYLIVYTALIVFFAYFYTQITLNPAEISKQIRENGGSIPGVRADNIEAYLTRILNRIILPGSLFLAFIALIPSLVQIIFNFPLELAMLMGGTSLLIMVGVDLDTMSQIEGHLRMHHQEGLVKKGKIRSRNL